ncbi:MAG: hypothetical protein ACR2IE_07075 [Candidatus Sumerlaeaceae bacterium]
MKHHIFTLMILAVVAAGSAKKFSDAPAGQGVSTVNSGGGADYISLDEAAKDFSSLAGGCTGNWTLLIASDLFEPNNVAFGNLTNGNSVTVRPAPSSQPTITFTTTTALAGTIWAGHLLIGTTSTLNLAGQLLGTDNFTIDGSNVPGGTTRDLKITDTSALTVGSYLVRVVGACGNATIKNAVIEQQSSGTLESFCVEFTNRRDIGSVDRVPTTGTVTNCLLRSKTSANGQAIVCRNSGTIAAGTVMTGMSFTSNTIETTFRGFFMNPAVGDVLNNTCSIDETFTFTSRPDLFEHSFNGSSGYTLNFKNNKMTKLRVSAGNTAGVLSAMFIGQGIAQPQVGTYNIENNFFGGFDLGDIPTTTAPSLVRAITIQGAAAGTTVTCNTNILHNSINMPNFANLQQAANVDRYCALALNQGQYAGTTILKNNIIRMEQNNGVVYWKVGGAVGPFISDYNVFYLGNAGAQFAGYNVANGSHVANVADFAAWQLASGQDANSRVVNPTVPVIAGAGAWASNSDLHFTSDPGSVYLGTPVGLTTDIDGQSRSVTQPVIGADELAISIVVTAADDWQLFN